MKRHHSDLTPAITIHPGELLKDEITVREMTQKELADRMGRPVQIVNMIINGKKGISEDTALDLEKAFAGELTADFWLRLDLNYRLNNARIKRQERKAS